MTLTSPIAEVTQITGTTALSIPAGTTLQRPSVPVAADLRFNQDSLQLEYYDGTSWIVAGTDIQAISSDTFVGDNSTTVFNLSEAAADSANLLISINGVVQHAGVAYGVVGTVLTFTTAPAGTDTIDVRNITRSYSFDLISDSGGATKVETVGNEVVLSTGSTSRVTVTANGILDLTSAETLRLPQYTTIETNALATPSDGDTVYVTDGDTGSPCLAVYDGTNWQKVLFDGVL